MQRHFLSEGPASRSQIKKVVDGLAAWTKEDKPVDAAVDRTPRLAFAGDYRGGAGIEAAVRSGLDAVTEITRLL